VKLSDVKKLPGCLFRFCGVIISFVKAAISGVLYAEAMDQTWSPRLASYSSYSVQIGDDDNAVVAIFPGMVYRKMEPIIPENY